MHDGPSTTPGGVSAGYARTASRTTRGLAAFTVPTVAGLLVAVGVLPALLVAGVVALCGVALVAVTLRRHAVTADGDREPVAGPADAGH